MYVGIFFSEREKEHGVHEWVRIHTHRAKRSAVQENDVDVDDAESERDGNDYQPIHRQSAKAPERKQGGDNRLTVK